jgi:hypothetical protein
VIPKHVKPGTSRPVRLKERPHLVRALQECTEKGGSVVMHGYTHQYHNESGEGHEFWDVEHDKPIAEYDESVLRSKMEQGIQELTALQLYPIAWETPHYSASARDYRMFAQYFSTAVERRQLTDRTWLANQSFPYVVRDVHGQTVIPENLGYIHFEEDETVEKKIEGARRLRIVRDAVAGVFYHPYYEPKYLGLLVDALVREGFAPFDLRNVPGSVMARDIHVFSGIGGSDFLGRPSDLARRLDREGRYLELDPRGEWVHSFGLDGRYRMFAEQWQKPSEGVSISLQVPEKHGSIFVIERAKSRPGAGERATGTLSGLLLGRTFSWVGTYERWVLWVLGALTLLFLLVVGRIWLDRTSYHHSHRRDKERR